MSRKSNKTEHVLKLITKNQEPSGVKEIVNDDEPIKENSVIQEESITESSDSMITVEEIIEDDVSDFDDSAITKETHLDLKERLKEELKEELREELKEELKQPRAEVTVTENDNASEKAPATGNEHKVNPPIVRNTANVGVVNLSELLVLDLINDIMGKFNMCDCSLCRADIMALALNYLPQKYVTTDDERQYIQLDIYKKQYEKDVLAALTRACVRVKGSPRHG